MVWRTWLLFYSRLALVSPSLNSGLFCYKRKRTRLWKLVSTENVLQCSGQSMNIPLDGPPQEGRALYQGLRFLTVCYDKWCIWRCPMANRRFCSLCYLCKHQLKVLFSLAVIGKPGAYFLATCCSKALWSLIWAKGYLFDAVTGALEAWNIPIWFSGMWGFLLGLAEN